MYKLVELQRQGPQNTTLILFDEVTTHLELFVEIFLHIKFVVNNFIYEAMRSIQQAFCNTSI